MCCECWAQERNGEFYLSMLSATTSQLGRAQDKSVITRLLRVVKLRDPDLDPVTLDRTLALLKHLCLMDGLDLMHIEGEKRCYKAKTSSAPSHVACFHYGASWDMRVHLLRSWKRRWRNKAASRFEWCGWKRAEYARVSTGHDGSVFFG